MAALEYTCTTRAPDNSFSTLERRLTEAADVDGGGFSVIQCTRSADRAALPALSRPTALREKPSRMQRLEEIAADSFRIALGLDRVGRDENFFDLGGDSLMAMQVAARLEDALKIPVSPSLIFQAPTPRALAEGLDGELRAQRGHLRALQPLGDRPPLFCMADVRGEPNIYLSLARHSAPDQPVYAVCPGPLEEAIIVEPRADLLTSAYVAALRDIRPTGPYRIVGYSFGGFPAFDLAQALRAEGEEVEIIMIDPYFPRSAPGVAQIARWLGRWTRRLALMIYRDGGRKPIAGRIVLQFRLAGRFLFQLATRRAPHEIEVPDWVPKHSQQLAAALIKAVREYRFRPFAGPTFFLQASERSHMEDLLNDDGLNGWADLFVGSVTRAAFPTDHLSLMRDPMAAQVADFIRGVAFRRQAQPEGGVKPSLFGLMPSSR